VRGIVRTLSTILTQAVEDELLPANPAARREISPPGRRADGGDPAVHARRGGADRLDRTQTVSRVVSLGPLRAPDRDARGSCWRCTGAISTGGNGYVYLRRNIVQGILTTPKNHQSRRIDLSRQLLVALRVWRRQQRRAWLTVGRPFPDWVFPSVTGTALDEANVRKAFNRILDAAGLDRRGPHQMRHTNASLLLQDGVPITYVSRQLGHKDASITLRIYAHWLPNPANRTLVDSLDDAAPNATSGVRRARSNCAKCFECSGEPGGNRTHNPQIKSPIPQSKTLEILMILHRRFAKHAIAKQINATQAPPENSLEMSAVQQSVYVSVTIVSDRCLGQRHERRRLGQPGNRRVARRTTPGNRNRHRLSHLETSSHPAWDSSLEPSFTVEPLGNPDKGHRTVTAPPVSLLY
jgi:hypothetical protein